MSAIYISIEKNIEVFEQYKELWGSRGIFGIRVDTMTEGIKSAVDVERSKADYIYFIDIVADDVDFMPQLAILDGEVNAPILIATSNYNEDEHHESLNNGAYFYAPYCNDPEKNIEGVIAAVNSYHRAKKQKSSQNVIAYGGVLISLSQRKTFVNDVNIDLTRQEFDILHLLIKNRGNVLTYKTIYRRIWGGDYEDSARDVLWNAITRLRKKLKVAPSNSEYIENMIDVGYRFPLEIGE